MRGVKYSIRTDAMACERALSIPFFRSAILNLHALIVALMLALTGCATQDRAPELAPSIQISDVTWWQVERDIGTASLAAKEQASHYARGSMLIWRNRVQKRTEDDFVPWFAGYWTQQWLAMKVAWYKLSAEEGTDPTVSRLAAYLQEQYHDRVLDPVAKEIDPDVVREHATMLYVQLLGEQLHAIQRRHGVSSGQFDQWIKDIPAIVLSPHPSHSASLYQIVHADPIAKLPAYVALIAQIRKAAGGAGDGPSDVRISPVAKRASEKLVSRLATSGGASAAAAAVGGVAGVMISLGAASYGAIAHENERPKMEAQIRENLNAAMDDMWLIQMEDTSTGVMAGVNCISEQIERSLAKTLTQPVKFEPVPRGTPLPCEPPPQDKKNDSEAQAKDGHANM